MKGTLDSPVVVFDQDGVQVTDWGQFIRIRDNDHDIVDIPRRTFMLIISTDLWDRLKG